MLKTGLQRAQRAALFFLFHLAQATQKHRRSSLDRLLGKAVRIHSIREITSNVYMLHHYYVMLAQLKCLEIAKTPCFSHQMMK